MNVYRFELKNILWTFMIWTVIILAVEMIFMIGLFPSFKESEDAVMAVFNNFPPQLLKSINLEIETFFSFEGFYAFAYIYVGIMSAMMAVSLSIRAFGHEKKSHCQDFLMTKPITRAHLFNLKIVAVLTAILCFNIIFVGANLLLFMNNEAQFAMDSEFILLVGAPFLTQLVFLTLGMLYATQVRHIRNYAGPIVSIVLGAYMITVVVQLIEKEALKVIAPFSYFDPNRIVTEGMYDPRLIVAACVLTFFCMGKSYINYTKKEIIET